MPLCHTPRNFVSEMVSIKRSRTIGEKKHSEPHEDKRRKESLRERVHKNQKTFELYTRISLKG
jgi:hypothetical protein